MMDRGTMNNAKVQKDKQRSTKFTHKIKYRVARTSLRNGDELMCFMHNLNIPNTFFMVLMDSCCSIFSVLFYISLFVLFVLTIVLSVDLWLLNSLWCLATFLTLPTLVCGLTPPHSTGFVIRLTRRISLVEQELLALTEHLSSPPVLVGYVLFDL